MDAFMDEFMQAIKDVFPNLIVQFEDFSTDNAFRYLDRYRHQHRVFNDDVGVFVFSSDFFSRVDLDTDPRHGVGHLVWLHQRGASLVGRLGESLVGPQDTLLWRGICGHWGRKAAPLVFHVPRHESRRGHVSYLRECDHLE